MTPGPSAAAGVPDPSGVVIMRRVTVRLRPEASPAAL
jgi:hypothetical protein